MVPKHIRIRLPIDLLDFTASSVSMRLLFTPSARVSNTLDNHIELSWLIRDAKDLLFSSSVMALRFGLYCRTGTI